MSHSLLPLILSSLLIATSALFPELPNPAGIGIDINVTLPKIDLPPIPKPQGGAFDININLPQPQEPTLPQPQEPQPPNMDEIAKEFLDLHNFARRHARLPPFVWDVKLEEYARDYANQRANSGDCRTLVHSMGPYGENLFWGRGSNWKPKDAVKKWIKEHRFYDQDANTCRIGKVCGHYTQVVWRDTIRLGCAVAICPNDDTLTVCSYDPPGNYLGEKPSIHYDH